jgi:hypothetical protein
MDIGGGVGGDEVDGSLSCSGSGWSGVSAPSSTQGYGPGGMMSPNVNHPTPAAW